MKFPTYDQFQKLSEIEKAAEFKKFCWWSVKVQTIISLGNIVPFWLFYYYTCINFNVNSAVNCIYGMIIVISFIWVWPTIWDCEKPEWSKDYIKNKYEI